MILQIKLSWKQTCNNYELSKTISCYSCMSCNFLLHVVSHQLYYLDKVHQSCSRCVACGVCYNGFRYATFHRGLDVPCASVAEPFFHQSHQEHPLYYTSPQGVCSACNKEASHVLRCVEDNCVYVLDFKCALLPYVVKHRVDDHFLS